MAHPPPKFGEKRGGALDRGEHRNRVIDVQDYPHAVVLRGPFQNVGRLVELQDEVGELAVANEIAAGQRLSYFEGGGSKHGFWLWLLAGRLLTFAG